MTLAIPRGKSLRFGAGVQIGQLFRRWEALGLAGVLVLSACLNLLQLTREGYANSYYAAAVKSMLQSWHNFFFVSFDPGGFVSVDKPPLGFWMQTASAKLFGFHGWSILLPQALAGVVSVAVLFLIVRRAFGSTAGLLAALALAITPVSVATNRNNTIDSQLVLVVLLATWAVLKATDGGRLRWLLLGMALVGLGFNIKMMEAYLVLPALVLVYFAAAPHAWWKRLLHLTLAGVVLIAVSFSWITAVDLTPASQRPYVGSSQHNSALELALGYNGVQRLLGMSFSAPKQASVAQQPPTAQPVDAAGQANTPQGGPPNGGGPGGGGPGGTGENGPTGLFRLFDTQLGGQTSWLIPATVLGLLAAWQAGIRRRPDRRHQSLIVWGVWLITGAAFFSIAGFFHRYYLSMLAPSIAALFGIGAVALWQAYRRRGVRGWLLPLTLVATAAVQAYILRPYTGWNSWLTPLVLAPCIVAALVLTVMRLPLRLRLPVRALGGATALGLLALLIVPAVWAGETVRDNAAAGGVFGGGPTVQGQGMGDLGGPPPSAQASRTASDTRTAAVKPGPDGSPPALAADDGDPPFAGNRFPPGAPPAAFGGPGPGGPGGAIDKQLEQFLLSNQGSARYLLAVPSSMAADQLILDTGKPVMAMGGFSGGDPILTADAFAALVKAGQVRYVMTGGMGGEQSVSSWVQSACTPVPAAQYSGTTSSAAAGGSAGQFSQQVYDCSTAK